VRKVFKELYDYFNVGSNFNYMLGRHQSGLISFTRCSGCTISYSSPTGWYHYVR
jgi:hypothetical protein